MINSILKNIPLCLRPLIVILGALGLLLPNVSETTFLFCLKSNITPLEINRSNEGFDVDNENLNAYFLRNNIFLRNENFIYYSS